MNLNDFDFLSALSDEQKTQLKVSIEAHAENINKGVASKNEELLRELKKSKADTEAKEIERVKIEEEAKLAAIEKDGSISQYKKQQEESNKRMADMELQFKEERARYIADGAVKDFSTAHVSSDPAARLFMEQVFRSKIKVVDGGVEPLDDNMDMEGLLKSIVGDDVFKNYVKRDVGSGAGSAGSDSATGGAKSLSQMTATEEAIFANQNPEQYAQMINY